MKTKSGKRQIKTKAKPAPQSKDRTAEPQSRPHDQRRVSFDIKVALSGLSTLDPFAVPAPGDNLSAWLYPWRTLEEKQHPFEPPHLLAYGGALSTDWHRFLHGPLCAFTAALGLVSPLAPESASRCAMEASKNCLKDMKCDVSAVRPHSAGWCIGFGISAAKKLGEWDIELSEFAKVSPELRRHLFNQAADLAERDTETARAFLNGFCDGLEAAKALDHQCATFKWRLYVALKSRELWRLSRRKIVKNIRKLGLATESQVRDVFKVLKQLGVPAQCNPKPRVSQQ